MLDAKKMVSQRKVITAETALARTRVGKISGIISHGNPPSASPTKSAPKTTPKPTKKP